jgi:methylglutamate dehydrogenase subunit C
MVLAGAIMTRAAFRLKTGGRIDRMKPLAFTFDGKPMIGMAGDTLASALMANGVGLVGRSFKYHRPRGIYSAGIEEPNALFTIGSGGRHEPNMAGPLVQLVQGMEAFSQNNWPSLRWDAMAVNQLAAPILTAGFYYKTFMGPTKGAWMFYEPHIRRAAGLGRPTTERDPDRYDTRHDFCDVLIIGSGPAGLAASLAAGRSGARVMLVEQDLALGGRLLSQPAQSPASHWLAQAVAELATLANVTALTHASAFGQYDCNTFGVVERHEHVKPDPAKGQARQVLRIVRAKAVIFATGAIERPLVFNGNDRPGVMLASGVQSYVNRFAVAPGRRAVVATNNDSAWATALDLAAAGVDVTVADLRQTIAEPLRQTAKSAGIDVLTGTAVSEVTGALAVRGAQLAEFNTSSKPLGSTSLENRGADVIAISGGWSPAVHLTSHLGSKPVWREDIAGFVPGPLAAGQSAAGAVLGTYETSACIAEGWTAAATAIAQLGLRANDNHGIPLAELADRVGSAIEPVWEIKGHRKGKAFLDLQNDVTTHDIHQAYLEGYHSVEHLKRYTTLGMGTDQGKTSNINALAIMAGLRDVTIQNAGTTTFRPPFTPISLGVLAGRTIGRHFRPIRRSPLHDWHMANGAEMIEAGQWLRAWYYKWAGLTPETAYVEEMRLVRQTVGLSDVSSLGKIDVQGPGATEFLNRVYVNGFAKLPVGKARYGVMLFDDGTVYDDGTTTRLGEHHYFMTTTTAGAGEIMSWLEYLLQTAWTDLDVHLTSLTDEWAAMAVSGPSARRALELCFPGVDVSNQALPYMGAHDFDFDGVPIRLIRLSFSGELAYEVYTPADHGIALWERILETSRSLGIMPYGLEALASLRIEKGHVAGIELDHRNTLHDLGLSKMAAKDKPFVGKPLLNRPALVDAERWSLVGLECLDPDKRLRGGSILFAADDEIKGHGRGYITAVTFSVELNKTIALALYKGGLKHEGDEIICAFPLRNEQTKARIVSPHFIDPRGERLHA